MIFANAMLVADSTATGDDLLCSCRLKCMPAVQSLVVTVAKAENIGGVNT